MQGSDYWCSGHLQDKLETVREDVGGKRFEISDESVTEVLREAEVTLINVIRRMKAAEDDMRHIRMTTFAADTVASPAGKKGGLVSSVDTTTVADESEITVSRPFNQRIDLLVDPVSAEYGGVANERTSPLLRPCRFINCFLFTEGDYLGDVGDLDDEELTRDKVKRASTQILQQIDKRKRKPKKKEESQGTPHRNMSMMEK